MAGSNIITCEGRFSFVNVFKPQKDDDGNDRYGLTFLFPDPKTLSGAALAEYEACIKALKADAARAAKEKWGDKIPTNLRSPFRDQGEKQYEGYVPGAIFINATSRQKPGVVDAQVQDIIDPSQLYSGAYGRISVRAFAYDQKGNRGVAFGLQNVQKTRDGEPLGGRTRPQDDFKPIADVGGDAAATANGASGLFD